MTKTRVAYKCSECDSIFPKWSGQCAGCQSWNTLTEIVNESKTITKSLRAQSYTAAPAEVCYLNDVNTVESSCLKTGISEFDRVVGGGLASGSVVLIGGDPGIGKSTLLTQIVSALGTEGIRTLYVSGEESAQQISLRGRRLDLALDKIRLLTETHVERILTVAGIEAPSVMVIDSIQTMYTELSQSAPGSVNQVRESAARLVYYAKQTHTIVLLIGHVTKDGILAGPRVLEHMVDTVLYFEGDPSSRYRMIRSIKNRYGPVNELGVFAMTEKGLREVSNPSAIFLSRHEQQVSGSIIMVTREGSRSLLVEVQALVDNCSASHSRRISVGLEQSRLSMLLAILNRQVGINTSDQDVFVNAVGGIKISETAADLAIILAVISSLKNKSLPQDMIVFGEVGLAGEIRPVPNGQERLNEATKHGFKHAIIPKLNKPRQRHKGIKIITVSCLAEAVDAVNQ